ncbi:hypothetical protein ALC56_06579, partial [Trachymyrmex septentrionalis]
GGREKKAPAIQRHDIGQTEFLMGRSVIHGSTKSIVYDRGASPWTPASKLSCGVHRCCSTKTIEVTTQSSSENQYLNPAEYHGVPTRCSRCPIGEGDGKARENGTERRRGGWIAGKGEGIGGSRRVQAVGGVPGLHISFVKLLIRRLGSYCILTIFFGIYQPNIEEKLHPLVSQASSWSLVTTGDDGAHVYRRHLDKKADRDDFRVIGLPNLPSSRMC